MVVAIGFVIADFFEPVDLTDGSGDFIRLPAEHSLALVDRCGRIALAIILPRQE